MQTDLRGRDLITEQEWTREEIDTLLDVAWDLKRKRATGEAHALLRDKVLAMLFFFTSTRTRTILTAKRRKFPTAIPPKKLAKSSAAIRMASPFASVTGNLAISTSAMWPPPAACRC